MRVLVAGSSGQIATALAELGAAHDIAITTLGRPALDLTKPSTLADALAAHRPDAVVNAAAWTAVDAAEADEQAALAINATGAGDLAAAAAAIGVPIFHLSTDYVFDGTKPDPYVETDPTGPASTYGRSKLAGEIAVAHANPAHFIFRTAWVHAPYGNNFVKTMLRLATTRDEIGVVADQWGSPSYAPDIADAIFVALAGFDSIMAKTGVYHVAGGGGASWADVAEALFAVSARLGGPVARIRRIATTDYPTPARRPANSRLGCTKFANAFGHVLPDWESGVARCITRLLA